MEQHVGTELQLSLLEPLFNFFIIRTFYSNEAWVGYRVASGLDPIDSSSLTNEALKP